MFTEYASTSLPNWKRKKSKKLKVGAIQRRGASAATTTYIPTPPLAQIQKKQSSSIATCGFDNPFGHNDPSQEEYDPTNASLGNQQISKGKYTLDDEPCDQTDEYIPTGGYSTSQNASVHGVVSEYDPLETNEAISAAQKYSIATGPVTDLEYDPLENSSLDSVQSSETTNGASGVQHEEYDPTEGQSSEVTNTSKYSVSYSDDSDINKLYGVEEYDPLETVKPQNANLYEYSSAQYAYSVDRADVMDVEYHPTVSPCKRKASTDMQQESVKKIKSGAEKLGNDDEDDLHSWEMDAWFSEDEDDPNHKSEKQQNKSHKKTKNRSQKHMSQHDNNIGSKNEEPLVIDLLSTDEGSDQITEVEVKISKNKKELKKKHKSMKSNELSKKSRVDVECLDQDDYSESIASTDVRNSDKHIGMINNDDHSDDKSIENTNVCENKATDINKEDAKSEEARQIAKPRVSSEQLTDFFTKRLQQPSKNKLKNRKRSSSENIFSSVSKSSTKDSGSKTSAVDKNKGTSDEDGGNIFSLMAKSSVNDRSKLTTSEVSSKKSKGDVATKNVKVVSKDNKTATKSPDQKNIDHKGKDRKESASAAHKSSSSKDELNNKHKVSDKKKLHTSSSSKSVATSKEYVLDKGSSSIVDKVKSVSGDKKSSEKESAENDKEVCTGGSKTGELKTSKSMTKDVSGKKMKEKSRTSSTPKHVSGDNVGSKSSSSKHKTNKPTSHVKTSSSSNSEETKSKNSSNASQVKDKSSKTAIKTFDLFGFMSESSSDDPVLSSKRKPSVLKTYSAKKGSSKKIPKDVYELSSSTSSDNELIMRKTKHLDKTSKEINRSQSLENHKVTKSKEVHVFDLTTESSDLDVTISKSTCEDEEDAVITHKEVHRSQSWAPQSATRRSESSSSKRRISEQDLFGEDSSGDEDAGDEVVIVKETSMDEIEHEVIDLLSSNESGDESGDEKVRKKTSKKLLSNSGAKQDKVKRSDETHGHKNKHSSGTKDSSSTKHKHSGSGKSNKHIGKSDSLKQKHQKSDKLTHTHSKSDSLNHQQSKSDSSKYKHSKSSDMKESSKHSSEKKSMSSSSKSKDVLHSASKKQTSKNKEADKTKNDNHTSIHKDKTSSSDKLKSSSSKDKCKEDWTSAISKTSKQKNETPVTSIDYSSSDVENYLFSDPESTDVEIPEDFHMNDTDVSFSETDTYEECLKIFNEETVTLNDTKQKKVTGFHYVV